MVHSRVGKERNITLVKQFTIDYNLNKTTNREITKFSSTIKLLYFISLPGYIIVPIGLAITTILIIRRKIMILVRANMAFSLYFNSLALFSGVGYEVSFSSAFPNKPKFYQNIFNIIIGINITNFWMSISLTLIIIIFFFYLCCIKEKPLFDNKKSDNNYKSLEDKKSTELQNKYDSDSEQNNNSSDDNFNQSSKSFPLTPEGIN